MATQYLTITTIQGDRWDLLADRMYGDATDFARIIAANPSVLIEPVIALGTTLFVPIIDPPAATNVPAPPWARAQGTNG